MKIDPNKTWKKVEERLTREVDPVCRRNLESVLCIAIKKSDKLHSVTERTPVPPLAVPLLLQILLLQLRTCQLVDRGA